MRMTKENEELCPHEARGKHLEYLQGTIGQEMEALNIEVADEIERIGRMDIGEKIKRILELSVQALDLTHEWYYNELNYIRTNILESGGPDINEG